MPDNDMITIILKIMDVLIDKYINKEISPEVFFENSEKKIEYLLKYAYDKKVLNSKKLAITIQLSKYSLLTKNLTV